METQVYYEIQKLLARDGKPVIWVYQEEFTTLEDARKSLLEYVSWGNGTYRIVMVTPIE